MIRLLGLIVGISIVGIAFLIYLDINQIPKKQKVFQAESKLHQYTKKQIKNKISEKTKLSMNPGADGAKKPAPEDSRFGPQGEEKDSVALVQPLSVENDVSDGVTHWQVFWKPFRTRGSAMGFRSRIMNTATGIDIIIMEPTPGEYVATFSYSNEDERQRNLALIEEKTGIKIEVK